MSTVVDIANLALTFCGAESILIQIDDACKEGRLCSQNYDFARRAVLAKAKWKFASKRLILENDPTEAPAFGWSYRYLLPEDYIRAISVNDRCTEFIREGRYILCNDASPINLRFVSDEESVELFDPLFLDCVAWDLATRIVYPLSQSAERLQQVQQQSADAIKKARFTDSVEQSQQFIEANDFVNARQVMASSHLRAPPGG